MVVEVSFEIGNVETLVWMIVSNLWWLGCKWFLPSNLMLVVA